MKEKRKVEGLKEILETPTEADASYGITIWSGAVFFYLINFGRVPFENLNEKKYKRRNFWIGYFLKFVFIVFITFVLINII